MSQMDSSLSVQNSLKTVMGVCLCLLVVTAAPASHTVLGKIDPPTDLFSSEQTLALLHFLRSVLAYNRMRDSTSTDLELSGLQNMHTRKRGFGIAGLDNVDMITSTLDRSRSRFRSRKPLVSSGLTLNQLRALMAKAG